MKSTNRRCANCKKKVPAEEAIIGGLRAFCGYSCMREFTSSDRGQAAIKVQREKEFRLQRTIVRKKHKTKGDLIREAQTAFNSYVRFRDRVAGYRCISCNGHLKWDEVGGNVDAGHYIARGSSKGDKLRFHLWNCHSQCVKCNRYRSGAVNEYRVELIWRLGQEKVDFLESGKFDVEYTREYLERVKSIFSRKLKIKMKKNSHKC